MNTNSVPLWIVRITAALLVIMGLVIWTGSADYLITLHILIGVVLCISLLVIAVQAFRAGASTGLAVLALVWAVALPVLGLTQGAFPESSALLVQIFHLLLGVGAWIVAEALVRQMPNKR